MVKHIQAIHCHWTYGGKIAWIFFAPLCIRTKEFIKSDHHDLYKVSNHRICFKEYVLAFHVVTGIYLLKACGKYHINRMLLSKILSVSVLKLI